MIKVYQILEQGSLQEVEMEEFIFPGGEVHVRLGIISSGHIVIDAKLDSSDELMKLAMIKEILDSRDLTNIVLEMYYIPYARQDRRCATGDAFSLKVFAKMINAMCFDRIIVADSHSTVATALLDNVVEVTMLDIIMGSSVLHDLSIMTVPVAPDLGASKKVWEVAKHGATVGFLAQAKKIRDPITGNITETQVDWIPKKDCLEVTIWDDICDGGRTFVELAKVLKAKGAEKVNLYVTHGIFSKGLNVLFDNGIDCVYTTNSLPQEDPKGWKEGAFNIIEIR